MSTNAAKTAAAWKGSREHEVTLNSGFEVTIRVPNLPMLVKTGQLPNNLVAEALDSLQNQRITPEVIAQQADFYAKLVAITVVEPSITEDEVGDLPYEDVELLVELATRQRDMDAVGHHIGGLHKSDDFRRFRDLDSRDQALAGF